MSGRTRREVEGRDTGRAGWSIRKRAEACALRPCRRLMTSEENNPPVGVVTETFSHNKHHHAPHRCHPPPPLPAAAASCCRTHLVEDVGALAKLAVGGDDHELLPGRHDLRHRRLARAPPQHSDLSQVVALCDDPGKRFVLVQHQQATDVSIHHLLHPLEHGGFRGNVQRSTHE